MWILDVLLHQKPLCKYDNADDDPGHDETCVRPDIHPSRPAGNKGSADKDDFGEIYPDVALRKTALQPRDRGVEGHRYDIRRPRGAGGLIMLLSGLRFGGQETIAC